LYVDSWFQGAVYYFNSCHSRFECQKKASKYFGRGFFIISSQYSFYLGGRDYGVPYGTVITSILDMRPGKHDLHFLVGVELLPHSIVNIPNETIHIGVLLFIFIIYSIFIIIILFL
jgi:hypothetical protein